MIISKQLTKKFTSYKKEPGIKGSLKAFFHREKIVKNAVESFDLNIAKGEIIGLLGPNGAGKTTLMKMFTGIIVPSSGELKIAGHTPSNREKEFRKKIALVMGQKSQLWWDIPAMDSFLLLQKYYEIPKKDFDDRINLMSSILDVKKLLHVHLRKLSLGERMKMELMASLLHSPEVIFLDEPTIGLDLVAQENIREFLKNYQREHKTTLVLTSHYMTDVQALCNRLVLVFDGKKAYDGDIHSFEKILGNEKLVSFTFKNSQDANHPLWKTLHPTWNEGHTQVDLRINEESLREISLDILKNFPVTEFNTEKMPIERVMKTLMSNPQILRQAESVK